jgi:hypothetical protein
MSVPYIQTLPKFSPGLNIVLGPSMSGKTFTTMTILKRDIKTYNEVFVISRNENSMDDWKKFFEKLNIKAMYIDDDEDVAIIINRIQGYYRMMKQRNNLLINTLLIYDDIGGSIQGKQTMVKNQNTFKWIATQGRHCGISTVFIGQDPVLLTPDSYSQARVVIMFYVPDFKRREAHLFDKVLNSCLWQWPELVQFSNKKRMIFLHSIMDSLEKHECLIRIFPPNDNKPILYKCKAQ